MGQIQTGQHKGHLTMGPVDLIKGEINREDFGIRAMPIPRHSQRPLMPAQGCFAAGFVKQWYAGHQSMIHENTAS